MGSHRVVLPESKFSGEEDVREFLRDIEMYVAVNEWSDEKAGQCLAVFLKDDATVGDSEEKFQRVIKGSEAEIRGIFGFVKVQERLQFTKP